MSVVVLPDLTLTGLAGFLDWFDRSCCSLESERVQVTFGGIGEVLAVILVLGGNWLKLFFQ